MPRLTLNLMIYYRNLHPIDRILRTSCFEEMELLPGFVMGHGGGGLREVKFLPHGGVRGG